LFGGLLKEEELKVKRFGELLFETTDDSLRRVFGKTASELVYTLMERHVSLKREEIGEKVEDFYAYLEKLLSSELAQIIQKTSLKRLCLRLRREYEEVERYFWVLDELYEVKFKLLVSSFKEDSSACN